MIFPTAWKVSKYGIFSGPYFPVFGLNTEIYEVTQFPWRIKFLIHHSFGPIWNVLLQYQYISRILIELDF